ncbi:hypothetical protein BAAM0499_04555 [Bifidobacterium animalis subsp. animalis MCC 0499]|nr:hypothetical protein BAAM0499_04555 [Bifidobacterium animalis subsp. animalis MCC 0499]
MILDHARCVIYSAVGVTGLILQLWEGRLKRGRNYGDSISLCNDLRIDIHLFEPSYVLNPKPLAVSMGTMLHLKMFFLIQSATSSNVVEPWVLNVRY